MTDRTKLLIGLVVAINGFVVSLVASFVVHATEAEPLDALGREQYAWAPRGWIATTIAQSVAVGAVVLIIAGLALAFVYGRPMTWTRAGIGAFLFVGLLFIIFAIIPNQFLTLTQSALEWTPQRVFVTIPPWLMLGNEVSISYAALKDIIAQGLVGPPLIIIPVVMYQWQVRTRRAREPKPTPVSEYGRPMRVEN